MAETRKKQAGVCVKNGANGNGSVEFFPAEQWGGPPGLYRLRYQRRWVDGLRGEMRFFASDDIGVFLTQMIFCADFCAENSAKPMPQDMAKNVFVSVPDGVTPTSRYNLRISTEAPFKGADGNWYIGAYLLGRGVVMVNCDDVRILKCGKTIIQIKAGSE